MKRTLRHSGRRHRQGMVLMELVVALFIFVTVAFALVLALDSAMQAGGERNEIAAVLQGMSNQMELLHAAPITPEDKDLTDDGSGIRYHLEIRSEQFLDQKKQPLPGIYRATITAKWESNHQSEDRSLSELIYQP